MISDDGTIAIRHLDAAGVIRHIAVVANYRPPARFGSTVIANDNVGAGCFAIAATWVNNGKRLARPRVRAMIAVMTVMAVMTVVAVMAVMTVMSVVVARFLLSDRGRRSRGNQGEEHYGDAR